MLNLKKSKLFTFSFILLFTCLINKQIKAQCHIDDWTALKALYESTDGDNWTVNTGWEIIKSDNPPNTCNLDSLFGIYLDENGRVSCIDLDGIDNCAYNYNPPGNNLTGILPTTIKLLSNLITLSLENNQLSGTIPVEIGKLKTCRNLLLGGNLLSGSIPAELGELDSLGLIILSDNQLTGSIPAELGNLSNLQYLYLYNNQLTDSIPSSFGNLIRLSQLNLSFNNLQGNIPPEIGKLSSLSYFWANDNNLSGSIPTEIGKLQNLIVLDLNFNELRGSLPKEIGDLNRLQYLSLHSNKLFGEIPNELGKLVLLDSLRLDFNEFSGTIPLEIGDLHDLVSLELGFNKLTGPIPETLGNLNQLKFLSLYNNKLSGCYPDNIHSFCDQFNPFFSYETYIVNGNNFTTSWDDFCTNQNGICSKAKCHENDWTALKALYETTGGENWTNNTGWSALFQNNNAYPDSCDLSQLWGIQLNTFGRVKAIDFDGQADFLQSEQATGNNLSGNLPHQICSLDSLINLNLNYNNLQSTFPFKITDFSALEELSLEGCSLVYKIPIEIKQLKKLTVLNLSHNQMTGEMPVEITWLDKLTELQLNNNMFTGKIPEEFTDLKKLQRLNIAHNELSGCYPSFMYNFCNSQNYDGNTLISDGNNFDSDWENFCVGNMPACKQEPCDLAAWNALKTLYEETDAKNWTINTGWNSMFDNQTEPPTYCDFNRLYGVEYSPSFGFLPFPYFLRIDLSDNQLTGDLPDDIFQLQNLTSLHLANNNLTGNIPTEISDTNSLNYLNLSSNLLTGNIPNQISKLNSLTTLNIRNNLLSGNIPSEISQLKSLENLALDNNNLSGSIPPSIVNLVNLRDLSLSYNQLSGGIPRNMHLLPFLWYLNLSTNQLTGELASEIGNLDSLKILYLQNNLLSDNIPETLYDLSKLEDLRLSNNNFIGNISPLIGNLTNLTILLLNRNRLSGNIPNEIGNLTNLYSLHLDRNRINGTLPETLGNLNKLRVLDVSYNELSGLIPKLNMNPDDFSGLYIKHNRFSCEDIASHFENNPELGSISYSPQYFEPANYDDVELSIVDSLQFGQSFGLSVELPFTADNSTFQWERNEYALPNANQLTYGLNNTQPGVAGSYELHIELNDCQYSRGALELISDPMYVVVKGYDLTGQPVEYNQIMVEFLNKERTKFYEEEILYNPEHYGEVLDSCSCNRELYLWEFPTTEAAVKALIEIDKKLETIIRRDNDIDGGFNNYINAVNIENNGVSYDVLSDIAGNYPDQVTIFMIDTGLDETGISNSPHLIPEAPVDTCYKGSWAAGYNYTGTAIDTNYVDKHGHGTFGFRAITNELKQQPNSIDLIPLKIFNENGQGNLFDLTCGIYHAVDHSADIINISAGYVGQRSSILEKSINLAREKGIFICTAAGNDTLDIDSTPQYPAYFSSQYHYIYDEDFDKTIDSIRYDNVISIAAIDAQNNFTDFSNYGQQAVTMCAYGKNIHSYGLGGTDEVWSGTSMATYFVTRELALEIAGNKNRTYQQIWSDFETNRLTDNVTSIGKTRTGKQLKVNIEVKEITGCTHVCSPNYNELAMTDDGSCDYESCSKCHQSDWEALKALYESTNGNNWSKNNKWNLFDQEDMPSNCDFTDLYGVLLNEDGRVVEINLYNNNLSGNIPAELEGLTELNRLFLAVNNLEGSIPEQLTKLTKLSQLILSSNSLSGQIPDEIYELVNLKRLHLSNNQIHSKIPVGIDQLPQLEYLTLDHNQLTGSLPMELAQLEKLYHLNISHNDLSGCYDSDLVLLCNQLQSSIGNDHISNGNTFHNNWESFCLNMEGVCEQVKQLHFDQEKLLIYPNPSLGKIFVKLLQNENQNHLFSILNLTGNCLFKIEAKYSSNNLYEIDLTGLNKGIYIIEFRNGDKIYAEKFILN